MKEFIRDVIIALAVVVLLSFVIKPTVVKKSSMEDTLKENNYLILYKLAYINKEHPDYGDIIVFKSGLDKEDSGKEMFIKRVIGVEGDTITIKNGNVYRNGEILSEDYIKDGYTDGDIADYHVPKDQIFVMGDNRAVSEDSRSDLIGAVSEDSVVGKAVLRLYPFSEIGTLN